MKRVIHICGARFWRCEIKTYQGGRVCSRNTSFVDDGGTLRARCPGCDQLLRDADRRDELAEIQLHEVVGGTWQDLEEKIENIMPEHLGRVGIDT